MIPQLSMTPTPTDAPPSSGGVLVTADGRELPLRATAVHADCRAGLGRITLEQTFVNPHDEPLRVTYQVPLPSDGAVSGFSFVVDDREIVGRVDRRQAARERFEQAIVEGRTAALLEQDRSSLFSQEVGNIPPGATVVVRLHVDQKLRWIDEGVGGAGWEWRFPTVVAPRYLGEAGRVADSGRVAVRMVDGSTPVTVQLQLSVRDAITDAGVSSPSHRLNVRAEAGRKAVVLADETAALDRDIVVRWAVARPQPGLELDVARPRADHPGADAAYGLLTLSPPVASSRPSSIARDLIVLLDTSGSMHGEPLEQAKRIVGALVDSLGERDQLELIEFSSRPRRFHRRPVAANAARRAEAQTWLRALTAGGGTEMRTGILEALSGLRPDAQRQVVVVSDGLIGFESEIVDAIVHRLPAGSRLHMVGVGSAVNRSLTGPAARAGRGAEVIVALGEDPERAIARLSARTSAPLVVELQLQGSALLEHAPLRMPDLFAGAPALVSVRLRPEGGELRLSGRTQDGPWTQTIAVAPTEHGRGSASVVALFGRERIEDLEMQRAAGQSELDASIEALGLDFQIATRLTSWVAVSDEASIDPRDPTRTETIPQSLPHGMSITGLGLRAPSGPMPYSMTMAGAAPRPMRAAMAPPAPPKRKAGKLAQTTDGRFRGPPPPPASSPAGPDEAPGDVLASLGPLDAADDEIAESAQSNEGVTRTGAVAARPLRGRLVLREKGRLVVEAIIDEALDWRAPTEVAVRSKNGSVGIGRIDAAGTTRNGTLQSGLTLRLAIEIPDDAQIDPEILYVAVGDLLILVQL